MASKLIQNTYKQLLKEPVEGFMVEPSEMNIFVWKVWMEGPPDTPFAGGIFELEMTFPSDFPMSPPELIFESPFWHPNVYKDGRVCISILHPPTNDPVSGELPEERWLPTQTVSTIILSVISILGDPNFSSPANVDASVECRSNPESYKARVAKLVQDSLTRVPPHVKIPHPESNAVERAAAIAKIRRDNDASAYIEDGFDDDLNDGGDLNFELDISDDDFDYDAHYSTAEDEDEFNYDKPANSKSSNSSSKKEKVPKDQVGKEKENGDKSKSRDRKTSKSRRDKKEKIEKEKSDKEKDSQSRSGRKDEKKKSDPSKDRDESEVVRAKSRKKSESERKSRKKSEGDERRPKSADADDKRKREGKESRGKDPTKEKKSPSSKSKTDS